MADVIKYVSSENLKYYDGRIKTYLETKDAALKAQLEEQLGIVAGALDAEILRAKGEEGKNATAAANAQAKGEEALAHSEALAAKVGTVEDGKTVMEIIEGIIADAYDDSEVRGLIDGLTANKADKTQVAKDIADAVKAEEDARKEAVAGVQGAVDGLAQTHGTDKANLEAAIALKADITALNAVSDVANAAVKQSDYDVKVKALEDEDARVAGLVATEQARAEGIEAGLRTDVNAIKADYLKATDKTALQDQITANANAIELLTNGVSAEEVDGVNDLIQYVKDHGTEVTGMKEDIQDNADAIAALEEKVGEKTVEAQITEAITGANLGQYAKDADLTAAKDRIAELEKIDHEAYVAADTALKNELNGEIAKKANATDLEALERTVATKADAQALTEAITALEAADAEVLTQAKADSANKDAVVLAEAQKGITAVQATVDAHKDNADMHVTTTDKAKWNAALQVADITVGNGNGTIAVKGNDIAVKGLGTAAYAATTAFDASGSAAQALVDAKAYVDAEFGKITMMTTGEIDDLFKQQ